MAIPRVYRTALWRIMYCICTAKIIKINMFCARQNGGGDATLNHPQFGLMYLKVTFALWVLFIDFPFNVRIISSVPRRSRVFPNNLHRLLRLFGLPLSRPVYPFSYHLDNAFAVSFPPLPTLVRTVSTPIPSRLDPTFPTVQKQHTTRNTLEMPHSTHFSPVSDSVFYGAAFHRVSPGAQMPSSSSPNAAETVEHALGAPGGGVWYTCAVF